MNDPLSGVGIVGCGFVAREHHCAAIAAAGGDVVAVADPDPVAAATVAAAVGGATTHDSHQGLLDNPRVGVVAVCTPPEHHREVAVAALESGRDVLVEKPLALSVAECDAILAAAARSSRTAAVGFNLRHNAVVAAAGEAIGAGEIGELLAVSHRWFGPAHESSGWGTEPARGGSLAMERGTHCLDLARFIAGAELGAATADGAPGTGPLAITIRHRRLLASIVIADAPAPTNTLSCVGEHGSLELDLYAFDGLVLRGPGQVSGAPGPRVRAALRAPLKLPSAVRAARRGGVFRDSYAEQWRALRTAIAGGDRGSLATLEDGRRAVELALAAERSARSGHEGGRSVR